MKRLWFAVIFLMIAGGLCLGEQLYIRNVCDDLNAQISAAQQYAEKEDIKSLEKSIDEIQNYWDKNNDMLYAMADHAFLDNLAAVIRGLSADNDEIKSALAETRAHLFVFYENQKISFANVF